MRASCPGVAPQLLISDALDAVLPHLSSITPMLVDLGVHGYCSTALKSPHYSQLLVPPLLLARPFTLLIHRLQLAGVLVHELHLSNALIATLLVHRLQIAGALAVSLLHSSARPSIRAAAIDCLHQFTRLPFVKVSLQHHIFCRYSPAMH